MIVVKLSEIQKYIKTFYAKNIIKFTKSKAFENIILF